MILWSIKITLLSVILILIIHNLFGFFKDTLTTPKIKDLVNKPQKRYDEIIKTIEKNKSKNKVFDKPKQPDSGINKVQMKDELKHFLSEIKNKPETGNAIQSSNSFESSNTFKGNDYHNAY